jgi:hypothetical protein
MSDNENKRPGLPPDWAQRVAEMQNALGADVVGIVLLRKHPDGWSSDGTMSVSEDLNIADALALTPRALRDLADRIDSTRKAHGVPSYEEAVAGGKGSTPPPQAN